MNVPFFSIQGYRVNMSDLNSDYAPHSIMKIGGRLLVVQWCTAVVRATRARLVGLSCFQGG